jgi:hypothetical protein
VVGLLVNGEHLRRRKHTPPSGLMTNGDKPQHTAKQKIKSTSIQIAAGHKTTRRQLKKEFG